MKLCFFKVSLFLQRNIFLFRLKKKKNVVPTPKTTPCRFKYNKPFIDHLFLKTFWLQHLFCIVWNVANGLMQPWKHERPEQTALQISNTAADHKLTDGRAFRGKTWAPLWLLTGWKCHYSQPASLLRQLLPPPAALNTFKTWSQSG